MKRKIFSKLLMGAFLIASVSMFVSCKDYDDDISKNSQEIEAIKAKLNSDVYATKSDLTAQLATVTSQLEQLKKDIAAKADGSAVASKAEASELTNLAARVAVLEEQIKKLGELETALAGKASAADLEKLQGSLDAVTGKIKDAITEDKVNELIQAALTTLDIQGEATKVFEKQIEEALKGYLSEKDLKDLTEGVEALDELLKNEDIKKLLEEGLMDEDEIGEAIADSLEKAFQDLDEAISTKITDGLSAIRIFVNKKLTSIVLKPNFYWEGIEGIEAPFIYQTPEFVQKAGYDFQYKLTDAPAGKDIVKVHVDTVMKWKGYDANVRELGIYVHAAKNAAHADFPTATDKGTYFAYAMNDKDNKAVTKLDIMYGAIARYNLNPSVANIDAAIENEGIGFYENSAPVYTRATGSIDPKVVYAGLKKDDATGLLTVPFTVDKVAVMKYFVDWTRSQTTDWEGNEKAATLEDWSKLWYVNGDKEIKGIDDKDAAVGGDSTVFKANLPFVALKIDVPADAEKGYDAYTVNSDWAVVVPGLYQIVALADKAPDETLDQGTFLWEDNTKATKPHEIRKNHLYETVGYSSDALTSEDATKATPKWNDAVAYGAIPMPATHGVVFNKSIDLSEYVQTHANYLTFAQYGKSQYDAVLDDMTDADGNSVMEKMGLEYRFKAIDYYVGDEKTSESAHIEQDATKPSVFYPRSVTEDGKTIKGETATREVVDREPLIRVDLVWVEKNEDGTTKAEHIIRYGYIKLRIVEEEATLYDQEVSIDLSDDLYLNCGAEAKITWSQVENLILAKLGSKDDNGKAAGITKNEFEKDYKLDVYGNYTCMPFIDPSKFTDPITGKTAKDQGDESGQLYTKTWQAKRYFKKSGDAPTKELKTAKASDYTNAIDGDYVECDDDSVANWTTANSHFGEIWYTPHDNATEGHNWDEKTNVLIWNLYPGDGTTDMKAYRETAALLDADLAKARVMAGGMNDKKYEQLMKVTGATYKNGGTSQEPISSVVRFINKKTGRSLWVTLVIPKTKIHFAYADINNRVLDHWYDFKTGYKDNTPDTIEVYANVPTPAEIDRATGVTVNGFQKDLTEYWLNQNINEAVTFHNGAKFDKFVNTTTNPNNTKVTFRFRLPEAGVNADFSADANGQWTVPGVSGATWTLELSADKTQIKAVKKGGTAYGPTVICELDPAGKIHWMGRTEGAALKTNGAALAENLEDVNEPANDILNYIGMYDKKGDLQKKSYLSGQQNKTFAAYVEVHLANDCYTPLIGKNYFNVRFLRPINVWPAQTNWVDAPNETQIYDIWRLVNIRDWRTYAVVLDGQKQQLDDSNIWYQGVFADGEKASVPYSFYNIKNIYVERSAIKSDAYLQPTQRVITADPSKLLSIDAIPALTGKNTDGSVKWEYLKIMPAGTSAVDAGTTAVGQAESTACGDILAYTNNGGVVKPFHVYVPVAVVYSHGALKPWTQTVYAIITIDPTVGNE